MHIYLRQIHCSMVPYLHLKHLLQQNIQTRVSVPPHFQRSRCRLSGLALSIFWEMEPHPGRPCFRTRPRQKEQNDSIELRDPARGSKPDTTDLKVWEQLIDWLYVKLSKYNSGVKNIRLLTRLWFSRKHKLTSTCDLGAVWALWTSCPLPSATAHYPPPP